jgi:virulence factor Mce-like protein
MSRRRATATLAASPVLVGAITVLTVIVGVYLAYNANSGLPFVPTYELRGQVPTGAKLVEGNDVRVGGFRVGSVSAIDSKVVRAHGKRRAVARITMKLDKDLEPLSADTRLRVRPRSALGVKYVELTPGHSRRHLVAGSTVPLAQSSEPYEFEDVFSTFEPRTRESIRAATSGFGDALTGRGEAINGALGALPPLLTHLTPVMRTLSDPATDLHGLVANAAAVTAQLAPVATTAADLAAHGATTFAALDADPAALQQTIEGLAPTFAVGTSALRRSRPVVADATVLLAKLRPTVAEFHSAFPPLTSALKIGTPVVGRSEALSGRLKDTSIALRGLVRDPNTQMALNKLDTSVSLLGPTLQFVAPYQTVCDYADYFFNALGEHQSQPGPGGNVQQQLARVVNLAQPNTLGFTYSSRPWDIQPGEKAQGATFAGQPAGRAFAPPYQPAIDDNGNADCQNGQDGFPNFRLLESFTRKNGASNGFAPNDYITGTLPDGTAAGANATVGKSNYPGLAGGTYRSRALGIKNLKDVP